MKKVKKIKEFPPESIITESFGKTNYADTYYITINNSQNYSIDYVTALFFISIPSWIKALVKLRNSIVKHFGLEGGDIMKFDEPDRSIFFPTGSRAVFFTVLNRNENEIVLAEDDKHLNFRTSLMFEKFGGNDLVNLYSATIVHYNNFWGRFYFFFVKPFHKLIIKTMLKVAYKKINSK